MLLVARAHVARSSVVMGEWLVCSLQGMHGKVVTSLILGRGIVFLSVCVSLDSCRIKAGSLSPM